MEINIRKATTSDIPHLQYIRHQVKENILSDPALVTDDDCKDFITHRGKGWVAETEKTIIGFSIVDLQHHNVWALFIHPDYEGMGVGKQLHNIMLDWYFTQTKETLWLGTEPKTRAERFYRARGWKEVGIHSKGEIKFEMQFEEWNKNYSS
jgi:GNAT superfamily N-acetyltransferase